MSHVPFHGVESLALSARKGVAASGGTAVRREEGYVRGEKLMHARKKRGTLISKGARTKTRIE